MSGDRFKRFLHLEKKRADDDTPAPAATPGRFDGTPPPPREEPSVEPLPADAIEEAPPAPPQSPLAARDPTFQPPPLPPRLRARRDALLQHDMELAAPRQADEFPFLRCALCEMDNNRFATQCANCREDLHTEDQLDYNRRYFEARQVAEKKDADELERLKKERAEQGDLEIQSLSQAQRLAGEAMAATVRQRENARLSWMPEADDAPRQSLGMRLVGMIPSAKWRLITLLGVAGLAIFSISRIINSPRESGQALGFQLFFLFLMAIFIPPRRRRRGWFGSRW